MSALAFLICHMSRPSPISTARSDQFNPEQGIFPQRIEFISLSTETCPPPFSPLPAPSSLSYANYSALIQCLIQLPGLSLPLFSNAGSGSIDRQRHRLQLSRFTTRTVGFQVSDLVSFTFVSGRTFPFLEINGEIRSYKRVSKLANGS